MRDLFKTVAFFAFIQCSFSLVCKICNSRENINCVINLGEVESKPCEKKCFVVIDLGGHTIRGCADKDEYCKGVKDQTNCHECNDADNCNQITFPDTRLLCHRCKDKKCEKAAVPCPKYKSDDKCIVAVKGADAVFRGCESENDEKCNNKDVTCDYCSKSGCNQNIEKEVECIKCSGDKCKRPDNLPQGECKVDADVTKCTAIIGQDACYTRKDGNDVTRGCLKDIAKDKATGIELSTCKEPKCNAACTPDIKCFECDSKKDPKCKTEDSNDSWSKSCPKYTTSCHRCRDEGANIFRGCGANLEQMICNYCYTANCPGANPSSNRHCYTCDEKDGIDCVLGKNLKSKPCGNQDDKCVVLIENGYTKRGCAGDLVPSGKECKEEYLCRYCNKENCNGDIYPRNRLQCYQCPKDSPCNDVLQKDREIKPQPCLLHDENDQCYTYSIKDSMVRGCVSDSDESAKGCEGQKCAKCNRSNCNGFKHSQEATIKCVQCNKNDEKCAWGQPNANLTSCTNTVEYWQTLKCFTSKENPSEVNRGCTIDPRQCSENKKCKTCEGNGCNNKNVLPLTCIRCRNDNPNEQVCAKTAEGIEPKTCSSDEIAFEDRGCYTMKKGEIILRGCLGDLRPSLRKKCKDNGYKLCNYCTDLNCNTGPPPNKSSKMEFSLLLLFLSIVIVKVKSRLMLQ